MNIIDKLKNTDKKILTITNCLLKICLLITLIASMILAFYSSTYILFWFDFGITLLKVSLTILSSTVICCIAFSQILSDIE